MDKKGYSKENPKMKKTAGVSPMLYFVCLLCYLVLITTNMTGNMYAKYAVSDTSADSARTAKWDIQINASPSEDKTFSGNMDNKMKESFSYDFSVSSNSEVSAKYYITVEFSGRLDSSVDLDIDGIAGTPNNDRTVFTFDGNWTFAPGSHSKDHTLTLTRTYQNGQKPENFAGVKVSISVIAEQID